MKLPQDPTEKADVLEAFKLLQNSRPFSVVLRWIASELNARDIENRSREWANKTTEAEALAFIVETVAACQAPVADRDSADRDAKETSAQPLI